MLLFHANIYMLLLHDNIYMLLFYATVQCLNTMFKRTGKQRKETGQGQNGWFI